MGEREDRSRRFRPLFEGILAFGLKNRGGLRKDGVQGRYVACYAGMRPAPGAFALVGRAAREPRPEGSRPRRRALPGRERSHARMQADARLEPWQEAIITGWKPTGASAISGTRPSPPARRGGALRLPPNPASGNS